MENNMISFNKLAASFLVLISIQACSSMGKSTSNLALESYSYSGSISKLSDKPTIFNEM